MSREWAQKTKDEKLEILRERFPIGSLWLFSFRDWMYHAGNSRETMSELLLLTVQCKSTYRVEVFFLPYGERAEGMSNHHDQQFGLQFAIEYSSAMHWQESCVGMPEKGEERKLKLVRLV